MAGRAASLPSSAEFFAPTLSSDADKLEDRLNRLSIVVEAMWSLLEDAGYSREDLAERIEQVDAADGQTDGRAVRPALRCPQCDSAVAADAALCQFCGWTNPNPDPLAGL